MDNINYKTLGQTAEECLAMIKDPEELQLGVSAIPTYAPVIDPKSRESYQSKQMYQ